MIAIIAKIIAIIEIAIFFFVFLSMEEITLTFYETISVIVASLAFLLSLYSAINTYYEKHIKTKVYLRWVHQLQHDNSRLDICILISNMSSRPSTITNVWILNNRDRTESSWYPLKLWSRDVNGIIDKCSAWSDSTPLNIPARSSKIYVLSFENLQNFKLDSNLNFLFQINETIFKRSFRVKSVLTNKQLINATENRKKLL